MMPIGRELMEVVAKSSQDECREIGEMLLALAQSPRDKMWQFKMAQALAQFPETKSDLATSIQQAKQRLAAADADLWKAGWHPSQMVKELLDRGYRGNSGADLPPAIERLIEMRHEWPGHSWGGPGSLVDGASNKPALQPEG